MITIGVADEKQKNLFGLLKETFKNSSNIQVFDIDDGNSYCDVLVWNKRNIPERCCLKTDILILNCEQAQGVSRVCSAKVAISWGTDERDTVALASSMCGGMASLQRQIVSLNGTVVEPTDYALDFIDGTLEEKMVLLCVMLVVDAYEME